MGDQDQRQARLALQVAQQVEDLRLHGHVERGGRFVGDQQLRARRQRHRDHDALAHAAREFVRIGVEPAARRRDLHLLEQFERALPRLGPAEPAAPAQHLGDLRADAHDRIERGHRLLEDHRHVAAAMRAPGLARPAGEFVAEHGDMRLPECVSAGGSRPMIDSASMLLPLPDSPTMPSTSPAATVKPTSSRMLDRSRMGGEADGQSFDREHVGHRYSFMRGSSTSRRPSPSRFSPSTEITIARPGKIIVQGAFP